MTIKNKSSVKLNVSFLRRKPFLFIDKLIKEFPKAEVYIVGGPVRDLLLGLEIKDCDFVVRNVKGKKLEIFLKKLGKTNLVGKYFGVFKFKPKGSDLPEFDIALPRTEHSLNFRGQYKDFDVQTDPKLDIKKDLARRDFTINAMAIKLSRQSRRDAFDGTKKGSLEIVDEFGGMEDLKNKIIKTVGKPQNRFKEDYSRMLRALRFSCQLDFEIDKNTLATIKKLMPHLNDKKGKERIVPFEVIAKELLKTFVASPVKAFDLYDKTNAFKTLMPEILRMKKCPQPKKWHCEGDVWQHTRLSLQRLTESNFKKKFKDASINAELVIGLLLHDIGKPYTLKTPQKDGVDRLRSNEHDTYGAKLAEKICRQLKLTSPAEFEFKIENIVMIIQKHLLLVHGDPNVMRNTTLEKYFFKDHVLGQTFLKLIYADASATVPPSGKPDMTLFNKLTKRLAKLEKLSLKKEKVLTKSIVTGDDLIKSLKLKQGPQIGKLLNIVREAQLSGKIKTKKQGLTYIKKYI